MEYFTDRKSEVSLRVYDSVSGKKYNLDADGCGSSDTRPAAYVEFLSGLAESFHNRNMASQPESLN